jgi:acyl carrier protein
MSAEWTDKFESVLRQHLPRLAPDAQLEPGMQLGDAGLNSLGVVRLLVDIEDTLGVTFPDELIGPDTFATPDSLWNVVGSLETTP